MTFSQAGRRFRLDLRFRAIASGLLQLDNPDRLRATTAALAAPTPPDPERLGERERRQ